MTTQRRKKPLRDRVASRKAGRSEYMEDRPENPLRKKVVLVSWVFQACGMGLLIFEAARLYMNAFEGTDFNTIIIYSVIFFLGRLMRLSVQFLK